MKIDSKKHKNKNSEYVLYGKHILLVKLRNLFYNR